jgi:membrane-bound inhibitor of C-type lysozyme
VEPADYALIGGSFIVAPGRSMRFFSGAFALVALICLSACNSTAVDSPPGSISALQADGDAFAGVPTLHYTCNGQVDLAMTPAKGAPAMARVVLGDRQWTLNGEPTETGAKYSNGQISLLTSPGEAVLIQDGKQAKCKLAA